MAVESTGVVVPFAVFVERQERLRRLAASVRGDAPVETKTDTPPPDPGPVPAVVERPADKTR